MKGLGYFFKANIIMSAVLLLVPFIVGFMAILILEDENIVTIFSSMSKINNKYLGYLIAFIPTIFFTSISAFLLYISMHYFMSNKRLTMLSKQLYVIEGSINDSHISIPDRDGNLYVRTRTIEMPPNIIVQEDIQEFNLIDILYRTDYYSLILTKDYVDYFFKRAQTNKQKERIVVVDKYCHGLLIYLTLSLHAKYDIYLIKKNDYLKILKDNMDFRQVFVGDPYFLYDIEEDKNVFRKVEYMNEQKVRKEFKKNMKYLLKILSEIQKKSGKLNVNELNEVSLRALCNQN